MMAKRFVIVLVLGVVFTACARDEREHGESADVSSRRVTHAGAVVGFVGQYDSHVWLGIPFAEPPVGPLRWRQAQPPKPWQGNREALAFGSPCMQFGSMFGGVAGARPDEPAGSEDCLYLNVYAPRVAEAEVPIQDKRWPVMVWIHGGGNTIGEAGFYNGGNLATTHRVVVVTVNYRLGPFGWFRHAGLRGDGVNDLERSGNFGTLDLVRSLEWIQENISAFGGDPNRVTIFGESAGGTNVFTMLLAPPARGLFHRAIVQSGGLRLSELEDAEARSTGVEVGLDNSSSDAFARLLIGDGRASETNVAATMAAMSPTDAEKYLRAKTGHEILSAYHPQPGAGMIRMPMLFKDGKVLPQGEPLQQFARADGYNQVPVMLGTNRDENKLFMFADPRRVRWVLWVVPRLRDEQSYQLSAEYLAKMWKATGADEPAAAMRGSQGPSVFVYRFDWDEEPRRAGADLSVMLGAAHAFEIPFVFGHFDLGREGNVIFTEENEPGRKILAAQMMSYWAEMAYTGNPGRGRDGTLLPWNAWDTAPEAPKFVVFDTAAGGGTRMVSDSLTTQDVLAAVDDDPRLSTQKDKCLIYRELAEWSRGFTKKEYASAGQDGCSEYPFDGYPWGG